MIKRNESVNMDTNRTRCSVVILKVRLACKTCQNIFRQLPAKEAPTSGMVGQVQRRSRKQWKWLVEGDFSYVAQRCLDEARSLGDRMYTCGRAAKLDANSSALKEFDTYRVKLGVENGCGGGGVGMPPKWLRLRNGLRLKPLLFVCRGSCCVPSRKRQPSVLYYYEVHSTQYGELDSLSCDHLKA
jgi:hypothetical protein